MERRIKLVWWISIITMTLIFFGQLYWLYTQYQYSGTKIAGQLKQDCTEALKDEEYIRQDAWNNSQRNRKDTLKLRINIHIDQKKKNRTWSKTMTTLTFVLQDSTKVTIRGNGLSAEDASLIHSRYLTYRFRPTQMHVLDSLLALKGYPPTQDFRPVRHRELLLEPRYEISEGIFKRLDVLYFDNPMMHHAVAFSIPLPQNKIMAGMLWQLVASLLMMVVLAFCLIYQIKTIMIQKHIDGLRHQFMKDMIFEMKQPKDETMEEGGVMLGDSTFKYDQNELVHGNERVMLTSRQAEIMRILSQSPNQTVRREDLLMAAWGDDSYANSMALNVQISYIRRAISFDPRLAIDVVYKKGYTLRIKG